MARITTTQTLQQRLTRDGEALVLTHTEGGSFYSTLGGAAVSKKAAGALQSDLFLAPSGDGLFPGHSQTWRAR